MPEASSETGRPARPGALAGIALGVAALLLGARALGLGDGIVLAATPATALALGAAVVLRGPGALAATAGFLAAGLVAGLPPGLAALDALAHGAGALAGATVMRTLARRRGAEARTRTSDWHIFLAGTAVTTLTIAAVLALGLAAGALGTGAAAWSVPARMLIHEPLGILTFGAVLASLREWPLVRADPRPALGIAALAALLIALLVIALNLPLRGPSASGITLLLSIPFCIWVAMQRRSLDGAALSFLAAQTVLVVLAGAIGPIGGTEFIVAALYLVVVVAICQLVHAVNRDRLAALAAVEAERAALETRVAERTAKLRDRAEAALAADAAKTRFLGTVTHEVRTPLSGVIGMANVALAGRPDPATRRHLEVIRTSGFHLLDVINRLLDFARRDQPLREEDMVDFDLEGLVEEVLGEARFLPYAAGVELRAEIAPALPRLRHGYRHGLRQVMTNLVGNAAKFTDPGGAVTLRLMPRGADRLRLEVEDTGIGIPAEAQARIFEPFEQGPQRRHGGTGLGLAITAEVVARLGGRIGVESAPGEGARFWVELALPLAPGATAGRSDRLPPGGGGRMRGGRVSRDDAPQATLL